MKRKSKRKLAKFFTLIMICSMIPMYFTAGNTVEAVEPSYAIGNGNIDVWDFGAEALNDPSQYNDLLTTTAANAVYPAGTAPGSAPVNLPSFTLLDTDENEAVKFDDGGKTNNRWRTSNTSITRYDSKTLVGDDGHVYTGHIYSNSSSTNLVSLSVYAYEGDILTFMLGSNSNPAAYELSAPDSTIQTFDYTAASKLETAKFYAASEGWYKLYCTNEKLVCARIMRQHTPIVTVSGTISTPTGVMPSGYHVILTNDLTGEEIDAAMMETTYSASVHGLYPYTVSLKGANEYIVTSGANVSVGDSNTTNDIVIQNVDLVTVRGTVTGLTSADLSKLTLNFTLPAGKIYEPEFVLSENGTYSLKLEKDVIYHIEAAGVNDYQLDSDTISASMDAENSPISFTEKDTYPVTVNITGASDTTGAAVTFTNIAEDGYVYKFTDLSNMALRDGEYHVSLSGLGNQAVMQALTPNLKVNGQAAAFDISVQEISSWDFAALNSTVDIETHSNNQYYAGLALSGTITKNKTFLLANANSSIVVPNLSAGDVVTIKYCYSAAFTAGTETVDEKSGSTTQIDSKAITITEDGNFIINSITGTKASQTYFCGIEVKKASSIIPYRNTVTVGVNKDYTTINDALDAIRAMDRAADQNVTILIDPGSYEEMLVIDTPNISLKNASATPSIELKDKGVNIDPNAVRITFYYGHGYSYYSMGADCKYDANILAVNKSNGSASFTNPGAGTTAGSYWNATVVISADNVSAEGIIFENSFNQYVSEKSVDDIIVAQANSAKEGTVARASMTTVGDTKVQEKEYVERAAALAILKDVSQIFFDNCKFVGRQDTLYGGGNTTAAFNNCSVYGGTDYIFGGMIAVFNACDLVFNTNDQTSKGEKDDVGYITAPQQISGRGYLFYNCNITSTTPGVDTASIRTSKPGYFGRPWAANTGEAVFYNTTIDAADLFWSTNNYDFGTSLIQDAGWVSSLSGESALCAEYNTIESSGVDNSASRASWSTVLQSPTLTDHTDISFGAFLGTWNPFGYEIQ